MNLSKFMNPYVRKLYARGMYEQWKRADREQRAHLWRGAMTTPPGPERLAMLEFLRMVEAHQRGEAA